MWGHTVGALSYDTGTGLSAFQYHPEWINRGIEINPMLPLSEKIHQFPGLARETYRGLPGAFADTLPDDFGNAVIDAWLARVGRDKASFTALERLLYTGTGGMGALEYAPSFEGKTKTGDIVALSGLIDMAQAILNQRTEFVRSFGDDKKEALSAIFQVGTSAGGARPKAVVGINAARTEIRSGQSRLPDGFEPYILKFDGIVNPNASHETFGDPQGFGRMEYAYYLMARAAGIEVSESALLIDGDRAHFMTRRFDRIGNQKRHYQSVCAMAHADYKTPGHYSYEQLFALMRSLRMSKSQALEMYRRMVFNIIARNQDDHTKNLGFLMDSMYRWQLAPAFDLVYSYRPDSPWVNAHQLTLNGKRDHFVREDLLVPAVTFRKEAIQIIEDVKTIVSQWPYYAEEAGVFPAFAREIRDAHRLGV